MLHNREQDYKYENDKEASDVIPFIEEIIDIKGNVNEDITNVIDDLGVFPAMELKFKELSFKVKTHDAAGNKYEQTILHSISGSFVPGSLVAIMGPSGS
ncbi:hypothetical protein SARC_02068 [Sphaeroforma arctica JP610]|uniref:ABC transporter domain-containing protein n=1 Tax=Sphaeroforma arctica JP610 TaxID=667725 RepID=A0A0L0GA27_9EUKA|nr:hypothetical protein SARC_02068 [Sphaeroforma arctica JP610]KNC85764.1 hypothetical protein SARC_02068 [Sphaeroforma arctica JP610]|eukprot:XP_014159666.1 hypothetical protein SARC_02068 [Sphaeroforma arctica JP610]